MFLALLSCEKASDIVRPSIPQGYIMFSTDIETKAALNESMRNCVPFGVMGYTYSKSTDWNTARVLEVPDVFYNVNVYYSDGIYTYDDLKSWDEVEKCSFFAYYPMASSVNNISISSDSNLDVPLVTYEFPFPATVTDIIEVPGNTKIHDLMTASAIDITSVGTGYVNLNFDHRLFCIEVVIRNYNDSPVEIKNLTLTLEGLQYSNVVLPMQKNDTKKSVEYSGTAPTSAIFRLTDLDTTIEIPSYSDSPTSFSVSSNGSEKGGYLMLIPQENQFEGVVSWDGIEEFTNVSNTFTADFIFEEGQKYVVIINIAGESITIAIIEEETWNSKDVNIEFN